MGKTKGGAKSVNKGAETLEDFLKDLVKEDSEVEALKQFLKDKSTLKELKKLMKDKPKLAVLKNVITDKARAKVLKRLLENENKINSLIKISKSKSEIDKGVYGVSRFLDLPVRQGLELMLCVPVFLQDPMTALEHPELGIQGIWVRYEKGLFDGPTSARVAVVDYNGDTQTLLSPIKWNGSKKWFNYPLDNESAPGKPIFESIILPEDIDENYLKGDQAIEFRAQYKKLIDAVVKDPYYHQLNVWAVVERVVEFYEDSKALGRAVQWGFNGNRLIVVPHAGYGQNAYYDRSSKSLQFFYYGDESTPGFTCLFHDVIVHETGHAVLDGIRPMYNSLSSVQTSAFHEYMGDITAILISFFNRDIRAFMADKFTKFQNPELDFEVLSNLAEQFGKEVEDREYLRSANNSLTLDSKDLIGNMSPHEVSTVLTGTMFDIALGIFQKHMDKNNVLEEDQEGDDPSSKKTTTPLQALWRDADRFRRVVIQPLDLCPPCNIQFLDYAKAVIRHDLLTNPRDTQGYRPMMLKIFHKRGFCTCKYLEQQDDSKVPEDCVFYELIEKGVPRMKCFDMTNVSRSRAAAYYFINENRDLLYIPRCQDFVIADLYESKKTGVANDSLPNEYVIEYTWREQLELKNDNDLNFAEWNGQKVYLDCGGTLVYDGQGNLRSWFHKPGLDFFNQPEIKQKIADGELSEKGEKVRSEAENRYNDFLTYIAELINRELVGPPPTDEAPADLLKPVTAVSQNGIFHFESIPHVNKSGFNHKEFKWMIDY